MDSDPSEVAAPRFKWDRYHIENYLLEPEFICKVLREINPSSALSDSDIYDILRQLAQSTLNGLVKHEMTNYVNGKIMNSINFGCDPARDDVSVAISESVQRSIDRISRIRMTDVSDETLLFKEGEFRKKFEKDLATDAWRRTFMGRSILKEFSSKYCGVSYLIFRDLIIARMKDVGFKPEGMNDVFNKIKNVTN